MTRISHNIEHWIPLSSTEEPPRDRYLIPQHPDGRPARNGFRHNGRKWVGDGTFGYGLSWAQVVAWCIDEGLVLVSIPAEPDEEMSET